MNHAILIIEDEKIMRISLADGLKAEGWTVITANDATEGRTALARGSFSLVITDVRLPDGSGTAILKKIKEEDPDLPVIVITGYGSIEDAVEAMRIGAFDYITKPFSLEEMVLIVKKALGVREMAAENRQLKEELSSSNTFENIVGESPVMRRFNDTIARVSRTDSTVLILGESGTGKELAAATIHYQSPRHNKPLIRVNCAALPETLIESELFGHEKGAFTGAVARKPGRFELADGGSIFLDEIGELPLSAQTRLLRVLEERNFERVGGTVTISCDVRVIAATNRDLAAEVKKKNFREDLFYRLNVIPVTLPPLREREGDIPLLIEHFTTMFNDRLGTRARFTPRAVAALCQYPFPGNVRELANIIERCLTLAVSDRIEPGDLPGHITGDSPDRARVQKLSAVAREAEKAHIVKMLAITGGNRGQTAELLGISRKSLWEKIRAYRITP